MNTGYLEQLLQIFKGSVWDGDLISKSHRDELIKRGMVDKARGMSFITGHGIDALYNIGVIK